MNPALFAILLVASQLIAAFGLLFIAGRLIRNRLSRAGAADFLLQPSSSRLIREPRALEDLLVEFIAHSSESSGILSVLATHRKPLRFSTIMQEVQAGCRGSEVSSAQIVWAVLSILRLAGLVRMTWHGTVITEVGLEIHRRMGGDFAPTPGVTRAPATRTSAAATAQPFSYAEPALTA